MPCRSWEAECSGTGEELNKLREELDKVTALLCSLCESVDNCGDGVEVYMTDVTGLPEWWAKHKEKDYRRKYLEAVAPIKAEIGDIERKMKEIKKLGGEPGKKMVSHLKELQEKSRETFNMFSKYANLLDLDKK